MLIDQQQKPSETLQEYVQIFSDVLLKSSRLLPHQAKDIKLTSQTSYETYIIKSCNIRY